MPFIKCNINLHYFGPKFSIQFEILAIWERGVFLPQDGENY